MKQVIEDKRKLPRLLCNDNFSSCTITIDNKDIMTQAINFHHKGICLYTANPIPSHKHAKIHFTYAHQNEDLVISDLPVNIVRTNIMDIGCQYGLSFDKQREEYKQILNVLKRIEILTEESINNGDRYGLFS